MGWFEKLKSFVKVDVANSLKEIRLVDVSKKIGTQVNGNVLQININSLDSKGVQLLSGVLKEYHDDGGLLIESESLARLEDFKGLESGEETKAILEQFKGKIPSSDLEILRYSIYLKRVFDRGETVAALKSQIVQTFGARGRNITNLYGTGYFQTQILPLYEIMFSQPNFSQDKFNQIYEMIVMESPYAVFVARAESEEELYKRVASKIADDMQYGIDVLNIHGIGEDNVSKIAHLLERLAADGAVDGPPEIIREEKVISVRLKLNLTKKIESKI